VDVPGRSAIEIDGAIMTKPSTKRPNPRRRAKSPEEKARDALKKKHRREIRDIFLIAGFARSDAASDAQFTYEGITSDFDDVFVLENLVVLTEYTTTKESGISDHIKPKYILYDKIQKDPASFIEFAKAAPLNLQKCISSSYKNDQLKVVILYCSLNNVKLELKNQVPHAIYLDHSIVRYFKLLTRTVRKSCQNEILAFLGVSYNDFADRAFLKKSSGREPFPCSVLPENHSNFPSGYKVVSFYIDPASVLSRAYVLRRDGWRDRGSLYQRMIIKKKIESIRRYLIDNKRVFVNNIIVTLPSGTKISDNNDNTVDPATITCTQIATVEIPRDFNSIGLIDGQHRVFSYYEGGQNEETISPLRTQQNLLATGIIYPAGVSDAEKTRFEAGLFLEINSTQSNAKSELTQAINQIIKPFAVDSIARDVLDALNDGTGALADKFARHHFDADLIKTTSIVSYGLRPLVRPNSTGPIFSKWADGARETFIAKEDTPTRWCRAA
jgi:DGQHR domain-containing protein